MKDKPLFEKQYPYIEKKLGRNPLTHIHLNENLFIEMNSQASPSIAIVEHSNSSSHQTESITFEWEFYNYPHDCNKRNMFGRIDLYSRGSGRIRLPGDFEIIDDLTISEVMDGYYRYKKIKEALNL